MSDERLVLVAAAAAAGTVFSVLYYCFLLKEPQRLAEQRAWIQFIRDALKTQCGFVNIPQQQQGGGHPTSSRLMALVLIMASAYSLETRLLPLLSTFAILGAFAFCVGTNQSSQTILRCVRVMLFHQIGILHLAPDDSRASEEGNLLRAATVVRAIASLNYLESLEESFLHFLFLSLVCANRYQPSWEEEDQRLLLLPLKMFLFAILPIHVLGINESISVWVRALDEGMTSKQTALCFFHGMTSLSFIIPLHVIFATYLRASDGMEARAVIGVGFILSGAALRVPKLGARANRWISPHTFAFYKPQASTSTAVVAAWPPNRRNLLQFFSRFCLAPSLILLRWFDQQSIFLALVSGGMVAILNDGVLLYNALQSNLFLLCGGALLLALGNAWLSSTLAFIGITSSFLCLLLTCAREIIFSQIAQENAASNFVAHSIKQRFASVGTAVEQLILCKNLQSPLLQLVLDEAKLGHAHCHASTISRKLQQGEERGAEKRTFENLRDQVKQTTMSALLIKSGAATELDGANARAEVDWEIFHLVLTGLARTGRTVEKVWCERPDAGKPRGTIHIKLSRNLSQMNSFFQRLVSELPDARFEQSVLCFTARMELPSPSPMSLTCMMMTTTTALEEVAMPSSPPPSPTTTTEAAPKFCLALDGTHAVLSSLTFAIVDDNALIRKNFERLLQQYLGVPACNTLSYGSSAEDCCRFPNELLLSQVDVAIFDQNLDFEDEYLKGSDLATEAKELGFTGCLILHSSDANLAHLLEEGVFHGAVEKTAESASFVEGIVNAWECYRRMESIPSMSEDGITTEEEEEDCV